MTEEKKNIYISYWLLLITLLVATIIVVGGLTRLTDSGLSITKWDLFTGVIPPLSLEKWNLSFSLYKQIPEFKLLNSTMTLSEFKFIFWWEYVHRLLGRVIGLFFLIPLLYFTFKKMLSKNQILNFYLIFILICFQGFIGWYMVVSGLSNRTDVSHYRLSIHLTIAFFIFILVTLNYLKFKNFKNIEGKKIPFYLPNIFIFLILFQITMGAFVSGLDAGKIYQTWPMMNGHYFPDDSELKDLLTFKSFETPSIVQFLHRNIAYFIFLTFLFILIPVYKNKDFYYLRNNALLILIALLVQIILGIFAVISGAQIFIASMHQIGSIFLITTSLVFAYKNSMAN